MSNGTTLINVVSKGTESFDYIFRRHLGLILKPGAIVVF